jgi:hypothetical protein
MWQEQRRRRALQRLWTVPKVGRLKKRVSEKENSNGCIVIPVLY